MFVPTGWLVSLVAWLVTTLVLWRGDFPDWFTLVDVLGWLVLLWFLARYLVVYVVLHTALRGVRAMLARYRSELKHYWIPQERKDEWAGLLRELDLLITQEEAHSQDPAPRFESYWKRIQRLTQGLFLVNRCTTAIKQLWSRVDDMRREWLATQLDQLTQAMRDLTSPASDQPSLSLYFQDRLEEQARILETVKTEAVNLLNSEQRREGSWYPLAYKVRRAWEVVHEVENRNRSMRVQF